MNRPTRNTLFGCVLCLILAGFYACGAQAQQKQRSPLDQQTRDIRKNFNDCFYSSAANQLKMNRAMDANMASEAAFQACATEEQAIIGFLALNHLPQNQAAALVTGIKLQLKKTMREIAAHPERYK